MGSGTVRATTGAGSAAAERPAPREQQPGDPTGFRLPFEPGLTVKIHQGWNTPFSHNGRAAFAYDFGLPEGTPVLAAAGGVVSHTHGGETACGGADLRLNANYVTIDHPDGSATQYGHLASVEVEVGDVVGAGQEIGRSGRTGYSSCLAHLHFARQAQGGPVTQSVPIYFDGYADQVFVGGQFVIAPSAACSPDDLEAPLDAFCGTYSAPEDGSAPYFSRLDDAIDFDWTAAAPGGYWLDDPVDGFSARWAGHFSTGTSGPYELSVDATDRVRISIDGRMVLNGWMNDPEARVITERLNLESGIHELDVEIFDADGQGALNVEWFYLFEGRRWSRFMDLS